MKTTTDQRRAMMRHPAGWIATGFGAGLSSLAPGTVGSFVALLPWFVLHLLPWPAYVMLVAAAFWLGIWACDWIVGELRIEDPGVAVWDEFVGLWIALLPLCFVAATASRVVAAFALFRFFDIVKPWPVSWADRSVAGGLGVMLDDVIAGAYAAAVMVGATLLMG